MNLWVHASHTGLSEEGRREDETSVIASSTVVFSFCKMSGICWLCFLTVDCTWRVIMTCSFLYWQQVISSLFATTFIGPCWPNNTMPFRVDILFKPDALPIFEYTSCFRRAKSQASCKKQEMWLKWRGWASCPCNKPSTSYSFHPRFFFFFKKKLYQVMYKWEYKQASKQCESN